MTVYQTLMNDIKNSSSTGAYIHPVPLGIQTTLHYSDKGILLKATYEDDTKEIPFETLVKLTKADVLIQRLQTYKAACKVFGVLVAPITEIKLNKCKGQLPECFYPELLKLAESEPSTFKFYAFDMFVTDGQQLPAAAALNRLAMTKFRAMNGLVISASSRLSETLRQLETIIDMVQPTLPLIVGLYVHNTANAMQSSDFKCGKVSKQSQTLDVNGYVHGKLRCDFGNGDEEVYVPYTQVIKLHLSNSSTVVLDDQNNIAYVSQPKLFYRVASPNVSCSVCGKTFAVDANAGTVTCADEHCPSRLYPQICRMLAKFNMPKLDAETFKEYIKSKKIKTLQDIFTLPEYADLEVEITLSTLIEAITPVALLSGDASSISKFVHQASSASAVSYYIHNPSAIDNDLAVSKVFSTNFKSYWSDSFNVDTFDAFIELPQIIIVDSEKKFDGDLIFRNKLICLTGEFKHGSYDEMFSILKSYAGTPTVEFSTQINCVVVGHFGKADPNILERAEAYSIPIFKELDFFSAYQIDNDLEKLHLI